MKNILLKGGTIINKIITWNEFNDKMKKVFGKSFRYVDDLYFNVEKEVTFGENAELEDDQALRYLQDLYNMNGELCVITDICYEKNQGPFIVKSNEIQNFVNTYKLTFGEAFYSTDIIIINFEEKVLWVLFHEGIRCV